MTVKVRSTIYCPDNGLCDINCFEEYSCQYIIIDGTNTQQPQQPQQISSLLLNCKTFGSCFSISITNNVIITDYVTILCLGDKSCTYFSIYLIGQSSNSTNIEIYSIGPNSIWISNIYISNANKINMLCLGQGI